MLLQTNSYIVPRDKRVEHARLLRRFRQTLLRLGCDHFEVYEQVGANWNTGETTGRFVQIMRFQDRKHQLSVQAAERTDQQAQALVQEFCELINFPYQQQQGLFAVGFYTSFLRMPPQRTASASESREAEAPDNGAEDDNFHHSTRIGVLSMPGMAATSGKSSEVVNEHTDADGNVVNPEDEQPSEVDLNADVVARLDEPASEDELTHHGATEGTAEAHTEENEH